MLPDWVHWSSSITTSRSCRSISGTFYLSWCQSTLTNSYIGRKHLPRYTTQRITGGKTPERQRVLTATLLATQRPFLVELDPCPLLHFGGHQAANSFMPSTRFQPSPTCSRLNAYNSPGKSFGPLLKIRSPRRRELPDSLPQLDTVPLNPLPHNGTKLWEINQIAGLHHGRRSPFTKQFAKIQFLPPANVQIDVCSTAEVNGLKESPY